MAKFSTSGLDDLTLDFDRLVQNLSDKHVGEIVKAGAEVIADKVRQEGETLLRGEYATGQTVQSVYVKKPVVGHDYARAVVTFKGNRPRQRGEKKLRRNAEVAFINNYGKRGQPARPFVTLGTAKAEKQSIAAAEKKLDEIIRKSGF